MCVSLFSGTNTAAFAMPEELVTPLAAALALVQHGWSAHMLNSFAVVVGQASPQPPTEQHFQVEPVQIPRAC